MLLDIEHKLQFAYDQYINESIMELRVEPVATAHQTVHSFFLAVGPPTKIFRYVDWCQNRVHHFTIANFHDTIEVISRSLVDTHPKHPDLGTVDERPDLSHQHGPQLHFLECNGPVQNSDALQHLADQIDAAPEASLGQQVLSIGQLVSDRIRYEKDITDYRSTTTDVLEHGAGVCQDLAHVMLGLLRLRHIPCRYVSGYLHLAGKQDPAESHAWVEVFTDQHGWIGYDPTHGRVPNADYVLVARGRHYDDVTPNRGIFRGKAHETIRAEVHARLSTKSGLLGLHEEIGQIDLPVYSEMPIKTSVSGQLPEQILDQQQQQQ